ncbi:acyl-CoA thioesterase [Salinirussus salinus]|jgi:acyl-CoA thioester hydrolase|uniref:acyl-CoA thioesterase n=1 Tax=Salinirussus salinus TaxID=1198300 RepID=UPI0013591529|nr:thioesterase family protein [Salinirussus salinus]
MSHETTVRVTWGDTDAGGLIYFPRFFHFVVVGLNDYFAPVEDHLMEALRREGHALPAVDAAASFETPLRAGEAATVETAVTAGETSLTVDFTVRRENGERAASGEVSFVLVDETFEPTPLPDRVHECVRERGDLEATDG